MLGSTFILLRPQILSYRNRLLRSGGRFDLLILITVVTVMLILFVGFHGIFQVLMARSELSGAVLYRLLSVFYLGFLFLLTFSSFVTSLSCLYASKDLPLLLAAPVSTTQLLCSKFVETMVLSCWMFAVIGLPALAAFDWAMHFHGAFFAEALVLSLLFLAIPTAIGILAATLFVNFFPLSRVGDLVVIVVFLFVGVFLSMSDQLTTTQVQSCTIEELAHDFSKTDRLDLTWLPPAWIAAVLGRYLPGSTGEVLSSLFSLVGLVMILLAATAIALSRYFLSGFGRTLESGPVGRVRVLGWGERFQIPFFSGGSPVRAIVAKEVKLFFRDSTQALQLALILMLTLLYLYNFKNLQTFSKLGEETKRWWEAILSLANIFMGASVAAAISTRFVYPSVSLEGRAYSFLRVSPLSIRDFLKGKFIAWFIPIVILAEVLLVSGAMAVQAPIAGIVVTALLAAALSIGIVGLGIGAGAVYGKFDWDSPAQVTSNFGSLVYMLLSIVLIILTMVPGGYLFIVLSVPKLVEDTSYWSHLVSLLCSFYLIFFINLAAARTAITAGEHALTDLER